MKLRVVELLLVTTLPALFLASRGLPPLGVSIATLIGGTLAAGAANAFNMVIESDSDRLMGRTAHRPIANKDISEGRALAFAFSISLIALAIMFAFTNLLATGLTISAITYYVFIYTIALKRRTSQNIVWGGIAGCFPVVIGWSAVTGSLASPALWFFLLIFFWTPPHFWALAIKYKDDYEAAGIPMLPVVATQKNVSTQMWFHTLAMTVTSFIVLQSADFPKVFYLANALLNLFFIWLMSKMRGEKIQIERAAIKIFHGS
ncbi:MAG: protoheme IX farnesyltransferase, partial [Actinobacteria bacterium]|nr:protoheme IX farnesyltransferase [Actinomycetota bacterium]